MNARIGIVALVLSAVAFGVGVFALTQQRQEPQRAPVRMDRVADLERQVLELTREVETLKAERPRPLGPDTSGPPSGQRRTDVGDGGERPETDAGDRRLESIVGDAADDELKSIVDDAVDRKTKEVVDELRIKANKKPAMEVFASMLKLTGEQRAAAERVVVDGQRKVHEILNMPAADGSNLMDQLVDIVAKGIAQPGKDQGFGMWFIRVASEKIPGTNETYGARIEAVQHSMRSTLKRDWSESQYKEFEEWGVNPTEIESVPGSPNAELWERIVERARKFGAELGADK